MFQGCRVRSLVGAGPLFCCSQLDKLHTKIDGMSPRQVSPFAVRADAAQTATALMQDDLKRFAAVRAVEQVESGMVLGLGTGSTTAFAVAEMGTLLANGKLSKIVSVPTSKHTYGQTLSLGIPLSTLDETSPSTEPTRSVLMVSSGLYCHD